jgi:hypothetical protein
MRAKRSYRPTHFSEALAEARQQSLPIDEDNAAGARAVMVDGFRNPESGTGPQKL